MNYRPFWRKLFGAYLVGDRLVFRKELNLVKNNIFVQVIPKGQKIEIVKREIGKYHLRFIPPLKKVKGIISVKDSEIKEGLVDLEEGKE